MIWHFIDTGFNTGAYNMEFDLNLASSCLSNEAYFRIYRWTPYCISLGANQHFEDIILEKAQFDNIDIVKRPTGGRAILHAEELTYSVVLPYSEFHSAKEIYQKISIALIKGLVLYNPVFAKAELENFQPNFPQLLQEPSGVLCFGSTAKNEVKFNGKKLIGSAQRKLNSVVLQHGSILCGTFHRKLVDYVSADENTKLLLSKEINEKTTEIETILEEKIDYDRLAGCLRRGFESVWDIKFDHAVPAL